MCRSGRLDGSSWSLASRAAGFSGSGWSDLPRTGRRGGFTVAEVLVALLVGVNLLAIVYNLFLQDQRRFSVDQARLSGLQGILVFAERLEADTRQMALFIPDSRHRLFTLDDPAVIDDPPGSSGKGNSRLTMLTFAPRQRADTSGVDTQRVVWALDPRSGTVTRNGDPVRGLVAEDLQFAVLAYHPDVRLLGLAPPPPAFDRDYRLHLVKVQVTALPEGSRNEPPEVRTAKRVTMAFVQPLLYRSDRANMPNWGVGSSEVLAPPE